MSRTARPGARRRGRRSRRPPLVAGAGPDARLQDNAPPTYTVHQRRHPLGHLRQVPQGSVALAGHLADEPRGRSAIRTCIYPGDVIRPRLRRRPAAAVARRRRPANRPAVARHGAQRARSTAEAIPSIPPGDIEPYLSRPLVTGARRPAGARPRSSPAATATAWSAATSDRVYVVGVDAKAGRPLATCTARSGAIRLLDRTGRALGFEYRVSSAPARSSASPRSRRMRDRRTRRRRSCIGDRLRAGRRASASSTTCRTRRTRDIDGRIIADSTRHGRARAAARSSRSTRARPTASTSAPCSRSTGGVAPIRDPRPNKRSSR
ncbi:MAG: hypothetical protein MZW92_69185 [Comamonadaceae bacterium]|nr:hypothetical protein [Comamonadaceae bacterium]